MVQHSIVRLFIELSLDRARSNQCVRLKVMQSAPDMR